MPEQERKTKQEAEYSKFFSLLGHGNISWSTFSQFSNYPELFRKAVGEMLKRGVLSLEQGCEVVFIPREYSMNFTYEGKRTYFTTAGRARTYLDYIVGGPMGKRLSMLVQGQSTSIPLSSKSLFGIRER